MSKICEKGNWTEPCPEICEKRGTDSCLTHTRDWRIEFQYLLDRKILSRDELAYLFGQIKSIVDNEIRRALAQAWNHRERGK